MSGADQVTAAILRPAAGRVGPEAGRALRRHLADVVPGLVAPLPPGRQVTLSLPRLRQLGWAAPGEPPLDDPFAWKPVFVRRSLGLAAISACLDRRHPTPAAAVGAVADLAVAEWERSGWRTFHWEPWFAGLGTGGRSAVLAEAATWATGVWTSLRWDRFDPLPRLGGPDDQWVCPAPRTVRLKGRSELRVALPDGPATAPDTVLVSVAGGSPGPRAEVELGYLALVAALRSPSRPPVRVIGLWPDAAAHRSVEVTEGRLEAAVELVAGALATEAGHGGLGGDGRPDALPAALPSEAGGAGGGGDGASPPVGVLSAAA